MKTDVDTLMKKAQLDALLVAGSAAHNPAMVYFTGLRHITHAYLVKKRDQSPILFHYAMERGEAADSGLQTKNRQEYDALALLQQAGGDNVRALAMELQHMFEEFDVSGRIGIYGKVEAGPFFAVLRTLEEQMPGIEFVGEAGDTSVLTRARATKDAEEVERIRNMGKITTAVVADVAGFLTSHQVKDEILVDREGKPLTIGDIKRRINLWLAMRSADNPEGCIFSIGRDAGLPHSAGKDEDPISIGKTIIFDIYPTEVGGGYFYDFTRTWCLGYAPDEVLSTYQDVQEVYDAVLAAMKPDTRCRDYQVMTCELFEERGHPTLLSNRQTQEGYVHSLGHGLGLAVHEGPVFSQAESNQDTLQHGAVFTHEPGLYYPERGYGVRIEDTIWIRPDGEPEILVDYPKDLILKMPGV